MSLPSVVEVHHQLDNIGQSETELRQEREQVQATSLAKMTQNVAKSVKGARLGKEKL